MSQNPGTRDSRVSTHYQNSVVKVSSTKQRCTCGFLLQQTLDGKKTGERTNEETQNVARWKLWSVKFCLRKVRKRNFSNLRAQK